MYVLYGVAVCCKHVLVLYDVEIMHGYEIVTITTTSYMYVCHVCTTYMSLYTCVHTYTYILHVCTCTVSYVSYNMHTVL